MKKPIIMILALCMLLPAVLSGCGRRVGSAGEVNVYSWGECMDESIFKDFEKSTGIRINYSEYQSNEELYALLRMGGTNADVIIPSDYMVARLIAEGMVEELDFSNIPNYSLVDEKYKNLGYDPEGKYSVAYMTGTVGLIYNSVMITDEITSWGSLFNSDYAGQILMFDNARDTFGIALKYLGYYQNTIDESELREAFDLLMEQKSILQGYVLDQIFLKLESGEAAIGPYYAGDYLLMRENNEDLSFVRPVEGSNWWVDAMCIPLGAKNKTNAELFINFTCSTDAALANIECAWYASANREANEQFAAEMDPEDREIMFASDETLANCDVFTNLPPEILALYDELWIELKK